ncbi:MAG: histidinol phosphate phosphatase [Acidobacteria bacterium]|nr:histidinol phosphate phosphatase [Acidobacteriota bacterium]
MALERELEVVREAARRAGELALSYQQKGVWAETKSDESPVTIADREVEKLISGMLAEAFPDDGLMGEEGAGRPAGSGRRWIIDPIDGTRDFLRGSPLWSVLIGLESGEEVVAGVVNIPAWRQEYYAVRGGGAWCNGRRIHVSDIACPSQAVLFFNGLREAYRREFSGRLVDFMGKFWAVRSMSGSPDAMLVAGGHGEAWVEPSAKPWDLAPIQVIVEEAGGRFFNFQGGRSIHAGNCVVCVPGLEAEIRRFLSGNGSTEAVS